MANALRVLGGGSAPANLTTLPVNPTTSAQVLTPTAPVDGYNRVEVAAVTAAIDANIVAGNIKKDVAILGVTGTYEGEGGAPEIIGYIDASMIDADSLLQALDVNSDGQITIADYNAIEKGDPATYAAIFSALFTNGWIDTPTADTSQKKYAGDFVEGGFAGLAIPLGEGNPYLWIVIDFGYIIDNNGYMKFSNYPVYRGAIPYNVPLAYGVQ